MKAGASISHGVAGLRRDKYGWDRRGFTLLEMCIVLVIMALLMGVTMPAMQSAFVERYARNDAHQLALLVKTAMLQSAEQHRAYLIELTPEMMTLHPVEESMPSTGLVSSDSDDDASPKIPGAIDVTYRLDRSNKLFLPDPEKPKTWAAVSKVEWLFQPGELCPAPRVRLSRGNAWLEMSFNALTGDVEDESTYFP